MSSSVQRTAESQNIEIRQTLWKYESVPEHHRREVYALRSEILLSPELEYRFDAARRTVCRIASSRG